MRRGGAMSAVLTRFSPAVQILREFYVERKMSKYQKVFLKNYQDKNKAVLANLL
jgi:hypothetical protein